MICTANGCYAESPWAPEHAERGRLATVAEWRHWFDAGEPKLNSGAALCPAHAGDEKELAIATKPRSKR